MADNNINNNRPFNANGNAVLQAAAIFAQMASLNNLQLQLNEERARNRDLEATIRALQQESEVSNSFICQRNLELQAQLELAREDQAHLALDVQVVEEEKENCEEELDAALGELDDWRERSNRYAREIFRRQEANERLLNSEFRNSYVQGLIEGMGIAIDRQVSGLQRQFVARDQELPEERAQHEETGNEVKMEDNDGNEA